MRWMLAAIVLTGVASGACRRTPTVEASASSLADASASAISPADGGRAAPLVCTSDPTFPSIVDLAEASAAVEVEIRRGVRELLVVSDSENDGAALAWTLPNGPARPLKLPLDAKVGDDVEGIAWRGRHLYTLVSSGYVERFTPDGRGGVTRDGPAYPLGAPPYVETSTGMPGAPPDFEGLCLRPEGSNARCDGYAASRAYGWLVCLVFDGDRLRVDPNHPRVAIDVKKHSLSDCAFGASDGPGRDTVLVATNIYGGSTVYRLDEETHALSPIDVDGPVNDEAVAIDHEGRLYQFMDANGDHSPSARASCAGW